MGYTLERKHNPGTLKGEKMRTAAFSVMLALFGAMGLGLGVLIWLSPVPESELTAGQLHLLDVADGLLKITFGGILGFMGAICVVSNRNRKSPS